MTNANIEKMLRWLGLVLAPAVLITIELFHRRVSR